jgi:hypothetical protein
VHGLPARVLWITLAASIAGAAVGVMRGWPIWACAVPAVIAWLPVFTLGTSWMRRRYGWLALFYAVVVLQGAHIVEHVAQMTQIHLLGRAPPDSRGIFGALDIEWVHFIFNTIVIVAVAALLTRFPRNAFLWVTLAIATWHQVEHVFIMRIFLDTGVPGDPGLLARGGTLFDTGFARPDLHFYYNLIETLPLFLAFGVQLRDERDSWLDRTFPALTSKEVERTAGGGRERSLDPGESVRAAEVRGSLVVLSGAAEVSTRAPWGRVRLAQVGPGRIIRRGTLDGLTHDGVVRADGPTVLAPYEWLHSAAPRLPERAPLSARLAERGPD